MTERLEVSRGPNSILYGFGSPAGAINVSSKQARTGKILYSLSNRTDSWGGQRWIVDTNLALRKNQAAVRAVVLRGREQSWRASGHNDQDRIFLAGKWQIDRRTTLRVEFEHGEINRFVPRPFFANDLKSIWDASGQPIFNNFAANYVPGRPGTGGSGTPGNPLRATGATSIDGVQERSSNDWVVVSDRFAAAQNYRRFTYAEAPTGGLMSNDFTMGHRNPDATLEANWVGGAARVNNASAFLQRELARGLNLELGFNRQTSRGVTHNLQTWNEYGVAADTNRDLPNGQLRPTDQLYYFDVSPNRRPSSAQASQGRVTLSYEKILRDLAVLDDPNFRIPGPIDLSGATKYQDPATGTVSNIYLREFNRQQGNINYVDRDTSARMAVAQAYFFQRRFVGTFGYRQDRLKNWVGVTFRDPAGEAIAPNTGVWTPADPRQFTPSVFNGHTRTLGGVWHVTPWLSGFCNTSSSINTPGVSYVTPKDRRQTTLADLQPSPAGRTNDYGLKLSLLANRVFVTATRFHTVSEHEYAFSGFNKTNLVNIWTALADSGGLGAGETAFARRQAEVISMVQGYTQDSESRGLELEVVGQILPGWSVSANYSRNETVRSNIAPEYRAYLDAHKTYWKQYADYSLTQNPATAGVERTPSAVNWRPPAEIVATGDFTVNTDSVNEAIADAEQRFFDNPHVFEGRRFVGARLPSQAGTRSPTSSPGPQRPPPGLVARCHWAHHGHA